MPGWFSDLWGIKREVRLCLLTFWGNIPLSTCTCNLVSTVGNTRVNLYSQWIVLMVVSGAFYCFDHCHIQDCMFFRSLLNSSCITLRSKKSTVISCGFITTPFALKNLSCQVGVRSHSNGFLTLSNSNSNLSNFAESISLSKLPLFTCYTVATFFCR